jgi:hypothetical protein
LTSQDYVVAQAYWGSTFMPTGQPPADPANGRFSWLEMNGAIDALCSSPYFSGLADYGAGQVIFGGPKVAVEINDPPAAWSSGRQEDGFTDDDIRNFLVGQIDGGHLSAPGDWDASQKVIYLVILPQGLYSKDHFNTAVGLHYKFSYQGQTALCAWNMQGGSLNDTTKIVAHEIVEAISSDLGGPEVGDACTGMIGVVNHVVVQGYTRADGQCAIPGKLEVATPPGGFSQYRRAGGAEPVEVAQPATQISVERRGGPLG